MECRLNHAAIQDFDRPSSLKHVNRGSLRVLQHFEAIFAVSVDDARCGDTARILGLRIQLHAVLFFRQVLPQDRQTNDVRKTVAHGTMMFEAPENRLPHEAAPGMMQGPEGALQLEHVAPEEAPLQIGFVELLAKGGYAERPVVPVPARFKDTLDKSGTDGP